MQSTDFGSIVSPTILGGTGRARPMARGGSAKAAHPHHLVIVAPSPVMGALMAAMLLHQAGRGSRQRHGALTTALAKRKRS